MAHQISLVLALPFPLPLEPPFKLQAIATKEICQNYCDLKASVEAAWDLSQLIDARSCSERTKEALRGRV